jgi:hypothetical protein
MNVVINYLAHVIVPDSATQININEQQMSNDGEMW